MQFTTEAKKCRKKYVAPTSSFSRSKHDKRERERVWEREWECEREREERRERERRDLSAPTLIPICFSRSLFSPSASVDGFPAKVFMPEKNCVVLSQIAPSWNKKLNGETSTVFCRANPRLLFRTRKKMAGICYFRFDLFLFSLFLFFLWKPLVLPWRKVFVLFHQVSFCIVPLKKTNLFVFKWFKTCSDNVKFHFLCYSFGTTYWIRNLIDGLQNANDKFKWKRH